jgi:hypothetical protein
LFERSVDLLRVGPDQWVGVFEVPAERFAIAFQEGGINSIAGLRRETKSADRSRELIVRKVRADHRLHIFIEQHGTAWTPH